MVKLVAPVLFALSILAPAAQADNSGDALPLAVLRIEAAMAAKCLPRLTSADSLLKAHNIKWVQGGSGSKAIVGGLLQEIDRMHGGIFMPFSNFAVDVNEANDIAGRQVFDNKLNMPRIVVAEPDNVALFIHEMGHVLGNSAFKPVKEEFSGNKSQTWYGAYNSFVKTPCHSTQYSKSGWDQKRRNEEFAEVVSGFFTRPQLLKNGSASCKAAYEFLRTRAFPNGEPKCLPVVQKPVTPSQPTTPTTPAQPTSPTTPSQPSTPITPSQPATPAQPTVPAQPIVKDEIVCTESRDDGLTVRNEDLDDFLFSLARGESVVRDEAAGKKQRDVEGQKLDYILIRFADGEGEGWVAERYIRERKLCPGAPAAPENDMPVDEHDDGPAPLNPGAVLQQFPEWPPAPAGFGGKED